MSEFVLGLDLGVGSVGWALVTRQPQDLEPVHRIIAGVRIFPEGVDNMNTGREQPLGQQRRQARGSRRVQRRRGQRKRTLAAILRRAGLLPADPAKRAALLQSDPYPLRKKGLDSRLTPHQFGRILFHLNQRRGFKSNRKQEKSKDDGKVAKATAALQQEIKAADCRTLGEYLANLAAEFRHDDPHLQRVRNRYTLRSMYQHEFEELWSAQRGHHPELLTDKLKDDISEAIFHQRPLRFDPDVIGECELEPDQKRCPRAHWLGQQFRMLQEINLLRLIDTNPQDHRPLNRDERTKLAEALAPKTKMTFDRIREVLGLHDHQTFNLESHSKRKYLSGNPVEAALQRKPLGKWYSSATPQVRRQLYDAVADIQDEDQLAELARGQWGLSDAQVQKLLKIKLPTGHFRVSLKAIGKLLPYLEPAHVCTERCQEVRPPRFRDYPDAGHVYSEAKELAGYDHRPQQDTKPTLPPVNCAVRHLTNPLVRRALTEARKVVNAIISQYGRPAEIVVELARDMKLPPRRRREVHFENIDRRNVNDAIRQRLQTEFDLPNPSRDDVIKYKLWKECNGVCPYTGRSIPGAALFTAEIQVEHILPYSRTLDDSYLNKSLCYADENRRKHNRTPFEAYGDDADKFEAICQRIRTMPYAKRRRFTQRQVELDDFISRQLNDTRYMSRLAVGYLRLLYERPQHVRCVKGAVTAELRRQWGLNNLLSESPALKKTRDDHRHHAVDALVIALTSRSALQQLSTAKDHAHRPKIDPPWADLRQDAQHVVQAINVSHRPRRKLAGQLHEDTAYGPGSSDQTFVMRKPVHELTQNEVEHIRDPRIRQIIQQAVMNACRAQDRQLTGSDKIAKVLGEDFPAMPSGRPIKRVRIERTEKTLVPLKHDPEGKPIKSVKPGGNHHVEIYQKPDGSWTGRAVSRFEAHRRLRNKLPIVNRNPEDGSKFVMSLCINDMVIITKDGQRKLYRVQGTSVSSPVAILRLHTAAKIDNTDPAIKRTRHLVANWESFRKLAPQKVTVNVLGRIHPCND